MITKNPLGQPPTPVAVGSALLRSKELFLEETPGLSGLDEKALLQTTLFGFPMLSVNMPHGRINETPEPPVFDQPGDIQPVTSGPGATLGLASADLEVTPELTTPPGSPKTLHNDAGDVSATWLEGPDGVAVKPTQPILPLQSFNVTSPDPNKIPRGFAIRGGTYVDEPHVTPLTAAPATELRGIHAPFFSNVFFPAQPWMTSYFGALGGGGTTWLHTTPVQHKSESGSPTMTRREFRELDIEVFFSGERRSFCPGTFPLRSTEGGPCVGPAVTPALSAPPTITGVITSFDDANNRLTVGARIIGEPVTGTQTAWVPWTIPPAPCEEEPCEEGILAPADLVQSSSDPTLWSTTIQLQPEDDPGDVHFGVVAVNGAGLVTSNYNSGAFYRPGSIPGVKPPPGAPQPEATTMTFVDPQPPSEVEFGATFPVKVQLTGPGGTGLVGKPVTIGLGDNGLPATTGTGGFATVSVAGGTDAVDVPDHRAASRATRRTVRPPPPATSR